jgi:hypothetical protein
VKRKFPEIPWSFPPIIPFVFVGLLYIIKGLMYIWEPSLSSLLSHHFILIFGLCCALIYIIFMVGVISLDWIINSLDKGKRLKGYIIVLGLVLGSFLSSVLVYSYSLYPRMPRGLGGGKPERIVIWIAKEDLPADLQKRIVKASFVADGEIIRCENIYLIYDDSATLIIADSDSSPASGALLPRDKVKAISW